MSLVKMYSDFTHIDWDTVWDKGIVEVLNTVAFIKEYNGRTQEKIKNGNK